MQRLIACVALPQLPEAWAESWTHAETVYLSENLLTGRPSCCGSYGLGQISLLSIDTRTCRLVWHKIQV